ncbi:MAG: glycosyltransferase [Gammaproteobacteria bacterium WSBS_2016_MAG_OTU1]
MANAPTISIIVPLAVAEECWRELLPQLVKLDFVADGEILFAAAKPPPPDWQDRPQCRWLHCKNVGRGEQMNEAAATATGDFLWFVHADTRLPKTAAKKLQRAIMRKPQAIHFFDLRFYDGGWRMRINELGVWWRCTIFANPFGDQALCVRRDLFMQIGGYPSGTTAGEDHLFVLAAAKAGNKAKRVGAAVQTSARKYAQQGWWKTMRIYQKIWWQQWRQR